MVEDEAHDATLASADWAFEIWDYNSAKASNILIRPMAYDNQAVNASKTKLMLMPLKTVHLVVWACA